MNQQLLQERIAYWTRDQHVRTGRDDTEDKARFLELYNSTYARQVTPSYYDWRFCDGASQGTLLLAEGNDRLTSACGYHLCSMSGIPVFTAALVVDMIVHPRHRGKGLVFARLNMELERAAGLGGAKAMFLFPNQKGAAAWLADKAYMQLGQMVTYVCIVRPHSGHCDGEGFQLSDSRLEISKVFQFDRWVDEVVGAFERTHPHLVSVKRDRRYLNWRFVANPTYSYDLFEVRRGRQPFGYLVAKVFRHPNTGESVGDIVDIMWAEDDTGALAAMLRFTLAHFQSCGVAQVTMWLQTNTVLDEIGRCIGFVATEQKRAFCCKVLDKDYRRLEDPSRWFLTMSDSEIY